MIRIIYRIIGVSIIVLVSYQLFFPSPVDTFPHYMVVGGLVFLVSLIIFFSRRPAKFDVNLAAGTQLVGTADKGSWSPRRLLASAAVFFVMGCSVFGAGILYALRGTQVDPLVTILPAFLLCGLGLAFSFAAVIRYLRNNPHN